MVNATQYLNGATIVMQCSATIDVLPRLILAAACVLAPTASGFADSPKTRNAKDGFESLFDGQSLDGWRATPSDSAADWRVENGVIVGEGSADRLSYLVWTGNEALRDFELQLEYRLPTRGNTGIEIRARRDASGKRPLEGYHADLGHVGIGPHILGAWDFHFAKRKEHPCPRGVRLSIEADGVKTRTERLSDSIKLSEVKRGDWNRVRIIARGNRFRFLLNGKPASEFVDGAREGRLDAGAIGLQIHDKGMRVEFRNLRLKRFVDNDK